MAGHSKRPSHLIASPHRPLVSLFADTGDRAAVEYFTEDPAVAQQNHTRDAISLIGAWSHLDWESAIEELDRIRHESTPTPPIADL
jgi:hypothetical protein